MPAWIEAYWAMTTGLLMEGFHEGGLHMGIDGFFALWMLAMPLVILFAMGQLLVQVVRDLLPQKRP